MTEPTGRLDPQKFDPLAPDMDFEETTKVVTEPDLTEPDDDFHPDLDITSDAHEWLEGDSETEEGA